MAEVDRGIFAVRAVEAEIDNALLRFRRDNGFYGRCGCCGRQADLVQDHDHSNGLNREKVCFRCNIGLGFFEDDIDALRRAIDYLKKWHLTHYNYSDEERRQNRYRVSKVKRKAKP